MIPEIKDVNMQALGVRFLSDMFLAAVGQQLEQIVQMSKHRSIPFSLETC